MSGFNIVIVVAVILFARLSIRLFAGYRKMKKDKK